MSGTTLTRRQTTAAIKRALTAVGMKNVRARSHTGTAWGWIHVDADRDETIWPEYRWQYTAAQFTATEAAQREHMRGEYGSQINIHIN